MSAEHTERLARVALSRLAEPGESKISDLIDEMGAVALYEALSSARDPKGLRTEVAERLRGLDPEADLARAAAQGIRYVIPGDAEWPERLDDLACGVCVQDRGGTPIGLWAKGPLRLNELTDSVAVVGSRSSTTYGADAAGEISAHVAGAGSVVISGAAFGIDQAAHRGALAAKGHTVAVLACGVDRAYPLAHANLLGHLGQHGAVISELPPGCAPSRSRFLTRNRLIAALSTGTVVVEAAARSGALNTANWATKLGRSLMAVPGPVTSASSQGSHQLIRTGAAVMVTRGAEVLEIIKPMGEHLVAELRGPERRRDTLRAREAQVLDAVPVAQRAGVESISRTAGLGLVEVRKALRRLEAIGMVSHAETGWMLTPQARA